MPYFPSEEEVQKLKASARCDQPGDDLNSVPSACRFRCSSHRLGDGTWGQVFAGRRNARGAASEFAVKVISPSRTHNTSFTPSQLVKSEGYVMERLGDHPNIVKLVAHGPAASLFASPKRKSLLRFERAHGHPLPEETACEIFRGIAAGLAHCHSCGVVHRDLKIENVLLTNDGVKLIDFGLSHAHSLDSDGSWANEQLLDICGSHGYIAPEVVLSREPGSGYDSYAADVWSLGVCLVAMLGGFLPFAADQRRFASQVRVLRHAEKLGRSATRAIFGWSPRWCNLSVGAIILADTTSQGLMPRLHISFLVHYVC
uniref:non-specific serine/threonine protein kinase n=1 Tax=Seriola lalandi dorsalis TaxID=1841481 RepID=A0A3B4WMG7_SERLL